MRLPLLALYLPLVAPGAGVAAGHPPAIPAASAQDAESGLAPDGKRGFGAGLSKKGLHALLRSKEPADTEFLDGLTQLAMTTRIVQSDVRRHYEARGYFKLLPGTAGDDVVRLHAAYEELRALPGETLASGDAAANVLAALLVDTKFNVRRELVTRALLAVDDLEHARALFAATETGYVELSQGELDHVAARADFAAAELRALRSDLLALAPPSTDKEPEADERALAKALLDLARTVREPGRTEQLAAALEPRRVLEGRMRSVLFSARAEPQLEPLRRWRDRTLASSAEVRRRVLQLLPDTPEGAAAPAEIARMKKTDRMSQAAVLALEGLGHDPLDPELAWAAGHARQFAWPGLGAVMCFDRYLALSGIRTTDANPASGRRLTSREQEAFTAVASFRR